MQTKTFRNAILCGSLFVIAAMAMYSCKKELKSNFATPTADEIAIGRQAVRDRVRREGLPITFPINKKIDAFYVDAAGNRISNERLRKVSAINAQTSACDYSNSPSATLNSYVLTFDCYSGVTVSWNYTISTNNNIVASNGAQLSKGKLYVYDGSTGTLRYSNLNVSPSSVVDQGADPTSPGYELFSVTFTSGWLATSYFTYLYTTKLGATLVTDCPDIEAFPIALQNYSATSSQGPAIDPCSRIDPIFPNDNSVSHTVTIFGEDVGFMCAGSYTYPAWQEVWYSVDGGTFSGGPLLSYNITSYCLFDNFQYQHYTDPYSLGLLIFDYSGLSSGGHVLRFMYRNVNYISTPPNLGCSTAPPPNNLPYPLPPLYSCYGPWSMAPFVLNVTR